MMPSGYKREVECCFRKRGFVVNANYERQRERRGYRKSFLEGSVCAVYTKSGRGARVSPDECEILFLSMFLIKRGYLYGGV